MEMWPVTPAVGNKNTGAELVEPIGAMIEGAELAASAPC